LSPRFYWRSQGRFAALFGAASDYGAGSVVAMTVSAPTPVGGAALRIRSANFSLSGNACQDNLVVIALWRRPACTESCER
jgi:hypothetical protein